jgi:myo-inositol 2-dehydrogenase/D-chiro-inositol 1-dehydrogenase
MTNMKKMLIGVIGAGRIGKLHVENIIKYFPHIKIKSIADPYLDHDWAKSQLISNLYHDENEMIADPEIEAILICSPVDLHVPQIIKCAQAGKHIFCEKPIATDLAQIQIALSEVKKAGVKFQIGFNRRFDPNFAKIKQMVMNKDIGAPHLLRITSRDPEIPSLSYLKSSSGMFLDMTIHDFDMARFLVGSEIQEVYASGNVLINSVFSECNDIDTAVINLKFANGTLGVIDNSRQAVYGYDQRVEIFGSDGAISAENNKPTNTTLSTRHGIHTEKPHYFFLERYKDSYVAELQAFFEAIKNDAPTAVTGTDGLLSVVVGLAAQQSYLENRPVKVNHEEWSTVS